MSGCPFASMWKVKDSGSAASQASPVAGSDLRHSHSGVHLSSHSHGLDSEAMSLTRAISTPHLLSEASTSTSSPDTALPTASAQQRARVPTSTPHDPSSAAIQRLTRRQLRKLGKDWSLAEVRQHARKDDAWIAVDGKVYDITEHLLHHPGWQDTSAISTVLSILAHAGSDCSQEFRDIHRPYPVAWRQLQAYYIGDLATDDSSN